MDKLANAGADGNEHCPGWSLPALEYIFDVRKAAANGHETLDTDASYLAVEAGDLACERYVLGKGKLQIEVLANLDKVAPAGALLFASWPRIEGATGLPARVYALTPKKYTGAANGNRNGVMFFEKFSHSFAKKDINFLHSK